ncbi:MAG: pcnB [Chlamydiales bacterium]|jgi:poly(A) polymerase|nr:pcnB [Chlamydiales bacterium]
MSSVLPCTYYSGQHPISVNNIDPDALDIIRQLNHAGFIAYLVGGSVRDLIKGMNPKDYDIATSATPEQTKAIFRKRCLLIGRRFRLAHVRYGEKVFEVSTFRAGDNEDNRLIVRDNKWGTPEEDVARRDFTINALFYDLATQTVIDYTGGYEDVLKGCLRTIGDPVVRFQQDPVRMIRLLKFKARFGFEIEPSTFEALISCRQDILKSASARLLEEMCRMMESSVSAVFFKLMAQTGLLELLQPEIDAFLKADVGPLMYLYWEAADKVTSEKKITIDRSVLVCCSLFPMIDELLKRRYVNKNVIPSFTQIQSLIQEVVRRVIVDTFVYFPNRIRFLAIFILESQYRLQPYSGDRHKYKKIIDHPDFLYALQFFYLRTLINPDYKNVYATWKRWWQAAQGEKKRRRDKRVRRD